MPVFLTIRTGPKGTQRDGMHASTVIRSYPVRLIMPCLVWILPETTIKCRENTNIGTYFIFN